MRNNRRGYKLRPYRGKPSKKEVRNCNAKLRFETMMDANIHNSAQKSYKCRVCKGWHNSSQNEYDSGYAYEIYKNAVAEKEKRKR